MHCTEVKNLLDDYLDDLLDQPRSEQLRAHLDACTDCREALNRRRDLLHRLRKLPVDGPSPGFAARAMHRARQKHQQRTRGFLAGFGTAAAAGVALLAVVGAWQPAEQRQSPHIRAITLQVQEPRTIRLAFNVPDNERYDKVRFRLELPPGVTVAERPGERVIAWQDRLEPGRNLLTLPLVAEQEARGELVARITVQGVEKVFRIPVHTVTRTDQQVRSFRNATPA